jgi:phosphotransferase system HPr-like phosphotransfer protein
MEALVIMAMEQGNNRAFAHIQTNNVDSLMSILKCHLEQGKAVTIRAKPADENYRAFVVECGPEPELPNPN